MTLGRTLGEPGGPSEGRWCWQSPFLRRQEWIGAPSQLLGTPLTKATQPQCDSPVVLTMAEEQTLFPPHWGMLPSPPPPVLSALPSATIPGTALLEENVATEMGQPAPCSPAQGPEPTSPSLGSHSEPTSTEANGEAKSGKPGLPAHLIFHLRLFSPPQSRSRQLGRG